MSEVEELRWRVDELEGVVLKLAGALASMRMAPNGRGPAMSWTVGVESIVQPLLERYRRPVREVWLAELGRSM